MEDTTQALLEFHEAFRQPVRTLPSVGPTTEAVRERLRFLATALAKWAQWAQYWAQWAGGERGTPMLRMHLIVEEAAEVAQAMAQDDVVATLHELTDLTYVVEGTYVALGLHGLKRAAFREVHRANMSKLGPDGQPVLNEAGRVLKSELYAPPDLQRVYNRAIREMISQMRAKAKDTK